MSSKRSRDAFESDLKTQQSPFVVFGTPLPSLDPEIRDDGSFVPLHKQEVRDEKGRRRLHGAFTGGWSAGYFNTVGSKEGWTPSAFVSSRSTRRNDGVPPPQQRPEDFMDDEDLADVADDKQIQTTHAFAGIGATYQDETRARGLGLLLPALRESTGFKLLRKMGWREGQGIGPKVRRAARLGPGVGSADTHLFAPDDISMISFIHKLDRAGLGFQRESSLALRQPHDADQDRTTGITEDSDGESRVFRRQITSKESAKQPRGNIGIGILNAAGSDDEDPYEIGPRISYNRVLGEDKKKKKAASGVSTMANPKLQSKPVFLSRTGASAGNPLGQRKCHDGHAPLQGYVLVECQDSSTASQPRYPPPAIPPAWKSTKQLCLSPGPDKFVSTSEAAQSSNLDPKARAVLLGETQLPGKSVFDFLTPAARQRLAVATGKADLPPARSEVPAGYALTDEQKIQSIIDQAPKPDRETALATLARGLGAGAPYREDDTKRARYRNYLAFHAGTSNDLPSRPDGVTDDAFAAELQEFYNCARIFKPMTGFMASRFTTSSNSASSGDLVPSADKQLLSNARPVPVDAAEEAAKLGMYGSMTRLTQNFHPTRLLCKRFNVKPPNLAKPESDPPIPPQLAHMPARRGDADFSSQNPSERVATTVSQMGGIVVPSQAVEKMGHPQGDGAQEGTRPNDDVFRAVFGDSDEE